MKIPERIVKTIANVIKAILTFNFKAIRIPFKGIRTVFNHIVKIVKGFLKGVLSVSMRVGSINADLVAGVISRIRGK